MIFFGVFPKNTSDIIKLKEALTKLSLNDNSLTYSSDYSTFLGSGFRVGFLGLLHADIVAQRLREEEKVDLLLTLPQIAYEKKEDGTFLEPYMAVTIYTPSKFVGNIINLAQKKKGELVDVSYFGDKAQVKYDMPFTMLISGLSSDLKSITSGFASLDYELKDYREALLKKVDILINSEVIDVLSELLYQEDALYKAREKAKLLKEKLPRQQFRQIIQATVDGQIVAREEIPPFRKDVLSKMSGGDRTRKDKLLEAQKKGKSRLSMRSKIILPQEVLFSLIQKN
jgi:GTP-binding protein LepA